jgi:hypothetical protein
LVIPSCYGWCCLVRFFGPKPAINRPRHAALLWAVLSSWVAKAVAVLGGLTLVHSAALLAEHTVGLAYQSPDEKTRTWGVSLIRSRARFIGFVEAPDANAAEIAAAKAFTLSEAATGGERL